MNFSQWLQEELNKRGWSQRDLIRQVRSVGYQLSPGHLSHILNETRQANAETCIGIAQALGLSREEIFRARGWLLTTPEKVFEPEVDPRAEQLARQVSDLPTYSREVTLKLMKAVLESTKQLTNKMQKL